MLIYHTVGTKEAVVNVEEQFLAGVYTPEFLESEDNNTTNGSATITTIADEGPHNKIPLANNTPSPSAATAVDKGLLLLTIILNDYFHGCWTHTHTSYIH